MYHSTRIIVNNSGILQYIDGGDGGDGGGIGGGTTIHGLGSFFSGNTADVVNVDDFSSIPTIQNTNLTSTITNYNKNHGNVTINTLDRIVSKSFMEQYAYNSRTTPQSHKAKNKTVTNNNETQDDGWSTTTGLGSVDYST